MYPNNVVAFPQQHVQQVAPQPVESNIFPSFPLVAAKVDSYAKRVPWWIVFPLGMYFMWKLMSRR